MTDRTGVLDAAQIRRRFPDEHYTAMHAPRYVFALRLIGSLDLPEMPRVLDVGASRFTTLLHEQLGVPIDTLGLESLHFSHGLAEQAEGRHYQFDLNDAQHQDRWLRGVEPYDLVTMAEVIEHVHTSPRLVRSFVRTLVRPGGTLILQTPNAAALGKRIGSSSDATPTTTSTRTSRTRSTSASSRRRSSVPMWRERAWSSSAARWAATWTRGTPRARTRPWERCRTSCSGPCPGASGSVRRWSPGGR